MKLRYHPQDGEQLKANFVYDLFSYTEMQYLALSLY